jgi:hypothetical protein
MQEGTTVDRRVYAGLFLVTLSTLMVEILLTRIFSVSMWYHFAFMAISIALFGTTVGALVVYLIPSRFTPERAPAQLAWSSLAFAVAIPASLSVHLLLPIKLESLNALLALSYVVIAVPFVLSGICVCVALTRVRGPIGRIYAADLLGAAAGCVAVVYALEVVDAPSAVLVASCVAAAGAGCFARAPGAAGARSLLPRLTAAVAVVLAGLAAANAVAARSQSPLLRLVWVKGQPEERPLYETWNSFSRISVHGDPWLSTHPSGWGLSRTYHPDRGVHQLQLLIDATAGTVLTAFDRGAAPSLEHLKYDVTNLAHWLRPGGSALVLGVGGGRDILAGLLFDHERIVGVEINERVLETVNGRFGDFTGHLDRHPRVAFVNDEARSWVERSDERFDIIQASVIDTWAATAAGAYMLSENTLYTVEAWRSFLEHLEPDGILTFSRFYQQKFPGETYRMTALANAALASLGVAEPREHIVVVRNMHRTHLKRRFRGVGMATILVSPTPFASRDLDTLEQVAQRLQFDVALSPRRGVDPTIVKLASGRALEPTLAALPLDLTPPTDDRPFFFYMLRLRDALDLRTETSDIVSFNKQASSVLVTLLLVVLGLTLACVLVPLLLTTRTDVLRGSGAYLLFFAAIGTGFMLVEISQLQRLSMFLGHPAYGLSVVLFALLLSTGAGSLTTDRIPPARWSAALVLLLVSLTLFGALTPWAIVGLRSEPTPLRIAAAVALLFPIGFLLGMAFPLGMRLAAHTKRPITPWLWGINAATSVSASVLAVVVALTWGISAAYWAGVGAYAVALAAFLAASRTQW